MKNSILLFTLSILCYTAQAQSTFSTNDSVDIGKVKSTILVHGDMNWDPMLGQQCEFPKGSGKHVSHITSIWMGAYDSQSQLRVAAQTYRQNGNDYWPGPLDNNGSLNFNTSTKWARIWKVSQSDILNHLTNSPHTTSNTPKDILEWPAKGNPHARGNNSTTLTITKDMAPFIDINNDGSYNALDGDYPMIKGDQTLWWVFSDNGPTHDNSNTQPLQVEVYAMAYAFSRNTLIDNVVFYEMQLNNRSSNDYSDFRIGINADMDIGFYRDDYVGFDSSRRLCYVYNSDDDDDGPSGSSYYRTSPPIAGFTILEAPGDGVNTKLPAGSFLVYRNDLSVLGYASTATEFNYFLRSQIKNGDPIRNDYTGYNIPTNGYGSGPIVKYMFDGDPADTNQWSECSSNNPTGDRRFVLASDDHSFKAQTSTKFTFALVVTDTGQNTACPAIDISKIQRVSDTAWEYYNNPPTPVSIANITKNSSLSLYPNPANDLLYISPRFNINKASYSVSVYDITGKKLAINYELDGDKVEVNISHIPHGVYHIVFKDKDKYESTNFVKK